MGKPKAKMGRPTEYSATFVAKAYEYLAQCQDDEFEFHKTRGEKSDSYDRILKVKLPTIEGLAIYLQVAVSSLYAWAELHDDFSKALEDIKTAQKDRLIEKGLSGEYNSTIAKLVLSSNHGMREKTETDVTSGGEKLQPVLVRFLGDDATT
jgi:hypothetical protein